MAGQIPNALCFLPFLRGGYSSDRVDDAVSPLSIRLCVCVCVWKVVLLSFSFYPSEYGWHPVAAAYYYNRDDTRQFVLLD